MRSMNPLTEDIRLATLLHIEFNRLRRIFPPHEFYQDAEGFHIPRSVVAAWLARPMWDTLMSQR